MTQISTVPDAAAENIPGINTEIKEYHLPIKVMSHLCYFNVIRVKYSIR